ncbi:MAG: hypothetical protein NTV51_14970 [Verrucomicrobia bacterium]|nr:hypothetical protein [Verrucomicrobiota bacterium]
MSPAHRATFADFLRRLFAAGGAALVLALTVFAASPSLHHLLHSATDTAHDESCPVVLFAGGTDAPPAALTAPLPPVAWQAVTPATAAEIFLSVPRYLRQPERGPPTNLAS